MAFKFENLKVWQKAVDFTVTVHNITREEIFILTSQFKRAADSIALNIAEGSTGQSNAEFNRFLGYAVRSGIEVVSCLHIAIKRELINQNQFDSLYTEITEIIKMTQALRNSIINQ